MLRSFLRASLWLAPALILVQFAAASDIPPVSFNELTDASEVVASGQITRSWTAWDSEHKYIWTHYELAVSASQKGSVGPTVDIAEPGGSLDGAVLAVSGATSYSIGDHVLVFLSRMPNGYLRTAGFGQGKLPVDSTGMIRGAVNLKGGANQVRNFNGMRVSDVGQLVAAHVRAFGGAR